MVEYDLNFHAVLAEQTGNMGLKNVYENMMDIFAPFISYSYMEQSAENSFSVVNHHEMFVKAIKERNIDYGRYAVKKSLQDWEKLNGQYFVKM